MTGITGVAPRGRTQRTQETTDLLRSGSRGPQVGELQSALNALGFNCGEPDGVFGKKTSDAVKAFQRANHLDVDGVVGRDTRAALDRARTHAAERPATTETPARQPASADTVRGSRARGANADAQARSRVDPRSTTRTTGTTEPQTRAPTGSSREITQRLDPMHNPRYQPRNGNTYCNVFTQDFMRERGVPSRDFPHALANDTNDWFHNQGARHGWRQVSGEEAQSFVNGGGTAVVSRKNPSGHGHIAPIIEGQTEGGAPRISNVGSRNFAEGPATQSPAFRRSGTEYWVYDPR